MRKKELLKEFTKKTFILVSLMMSVVVSGCSKDDDEPTTGFSNDEREALQVLNGTFSYEGVMDATTIVFSPYSSPVQKKSTMNDVPISFHGKMQYKSKYNEAEYYFYVNTEKGQIVANSVHSEKSDYFNALVGKTWAYTIVDNNTIKLFDTDLSDPLFHTNTYTKK